VPGGDSLLVPATGRRFVSLPLLQPSEAEHGMRRSVAVAGGERLLIPAAGRILLMTGEF
jgi:hypothetical protein